MYGIFIAGSRPRSKKEIKELAKLITEELQRLDWKLKPEDSDYAPPTPAIAYSLVLQATSLFGNEFDGSIAAALRADNGNPDPTFMGRGYTFVGPDPYTNRKFYGTISFDAKKVAIVVT